jgi:hypothetical protein
MAAKLVSGEVLSMHSLKSPFGPYAIGRRYQKGQALVFITLSSVVMFGALGLTVDVGWAYFRKMACTRAAESAAMAAVLAAKAEGLDKATIQAETACPGSPVLSTTNNLSNGCLYAQANGFVTTGNASSNRWAKTVTMAGGKTNPPASVPLANLAYWTSSVVSENIPTLFSAVLRKTGMTVSARATAGIFIAPKPGCIYALDPLAPDALNVNGTTALSSGCGVYVDSSNASALNMVGGSSITTTGGATTNVVGGVSQASNATISPAAVSGSPAFTDPFTVMQAPATGACQPNVNLNGHQSATINPGTYCSQISLTGGQSLTLNAGTYVLQAGLSLGGGTSFTSNGGVTIYIAGGSISVGGGAVVTLNAPTSGPYQGVLLWQARTDTSLASLEGGAAQTLNGLLYFPTAALKYAGGSDTNMSNSTILANTINFDGNSYLANPANTTITVNGGPNGIFLVQ